MATSSSCKEAEPFQKGIPSLRTIESALKLVDSKKENLKKAYEDLRSFPSSSSFLPFSWSDLDSHFSSLHHSLSSRFLLLLQSYDSTPAQQPVPFSSPRPQLNPDNATGNPPQNSHGGPDPGEERKEEDGNLPNDPDPAAAPPELVLLCKRMDGKGLRGYVCESAKERNLIRAELAASLRVAPDPGSLVVDAVAGCTWGNSEEKKSCVAILEALVEMKPENVKEEVRERAKGLGLEWIKKVNLKAGVSPEVLGLLNLVAAFRLVKEFDVGELIGCFVAVSASASATKLCKEVGLEEKATACLIEKLIEDEKQLLAVRFICELGLTDKFQPVDILRTYLKKLKKNRTKSCKEGKHSLGVKNNIRSREINALTSAMRIFEEYKLQYPKGDLENRIRMLEKQKADELRAPSPDKIYQKQKELEKNQKQQTQNGNKRPRTSGPTVPVPRPIGFGSSPLPPIVQLPVARPYGLVDPVAPYAGPSTGPYGFPGASVGYPGHPNAAGAHLYPREPYMPPPPFSGYRLPNPYHHPAYYPM